MSKAPDTSELYYAEMEAERNNAEIGYFNARPHLDSRANRDMFAAGFERAFRKIPYVHHSIAHKYASEVERLRASIASLAERMRNYHPCHDAGPAYAAGKASATAHWLKEIESIAAQESGLSEAEIERQSRRVE